MKEREEHNTDHVLSLKDIEREREVALKASLHGSIEYVRMARQIESAVIDKLRRVECNPLLLIDLLEKITARIPVLDMSAFGFVSAADANQREVDAFVACAEWIGTTCRVAPTETEVETEARRRYGPKPAPIPWKTGASGMAYAMSGNKLVVSQIDGLIPGSWVEPQLIRAEDLPVVWRLLHPEEK